MIVIDLVNGDDIIVIRPEKTPEEEAKLEEMRKRALEEIFRRAPQPQVIPTEK